MQWVLDLFAGLLVGSALLVFVGFVLWVGGKG